MLCHHRTWVRAYRLSSYYALITLHDHTVRIDTTHDSSLCKIFHNFYKYTISKKSFNLPIFVSSGISPDNYTTIDFNNSRTTVTWILLHTTTTHPPLTVSVCTTFWTLALPDWPRWVSFSWFHFVLSIAASVPGTQTRSVKQLFFSHLIQRQNDHLCAPLVQYRPWPKTLRTLSS